MSRIMEDLLKMIETAQSMNPRIVKRHFGPVSLRAGVRSMHTTPATRLALLSCAEYHLPGLSLEAVFGIGHG